ncbi:intersectin-1-like isoform X6 [Asterias rubens]|uniref:intersectin-1-like isoform X6 n=1 Tax=Asterias rubens TaxID=7604 RepID=UPI001454F63C|nr:intersectin-1-like isoform X6 [Asterias rubens]
MEVYEAKYDYVRERDDVLSFTKGEKFHITSKTNEKWWAAKKVSDNSHGYVPSVYLQPCQEKVIGRLLPEGRLDTKEHRIHLQALAEIHKKVKPLPVRSRSASCPAHVIGQALGVELYSSDEDEMPQRVVPQKPIKMNSSGRFSSLSSEESNDRSPTSPGGDDAFQIKPKPLPNPVKDSREHKQLHRELRMSYKSGNVLPQKPELMVVHRERKLEEKRKEQLREQKSRRTSMEIKLLERQEKERVEEEKEQRMMKMKENEAIAEERKPEFMKVRLKQTNSLPRS